MPQSDICPLCGSEAQVSLPTLEEHWQNIKGSFHAKRAAVIALAGNHTIGMLGHRQNYHEDFRSILDGLLHWACLCPCGWFNDPAHECVCSAKQIERHQAEKVRPSLFKRAMQCDLIVAIQTPRARDLLNDRPGESFEEVLKRVARARKMEAVNPNLDSASGSLMEHAITQLALGPPRVKQIRSVAATLSDGRKGSLMKTTEKRDAVGSMLINGKTISVYLSDDCQFYATVAGKKYSAASLKQLQAVASKVTNDTTFDPQRLELASLDTAQRVIEGHYEDNLRRVSVHISYEDEKDCYEVAVSASAKGRQHGKEFDQASDLLAADVKVEVERRLAQNEWKFLKAPASDSRGQWHRRAGRTYNYWRNPRQGTRISHTQLLDSACEYLQSTFDLERVQDDKRIRLREDEIMLKLKNGQLFTIDIDERGF